MQNRDPTNYDTLLEMIRRQVNTFNKRLPHPQWQRERGPTSHLMDYQVDHSIVLNLGQALAIAMLNVVPILAYKGVNPSFNIQ